jgi:hypothetical protein
VCQRFGNRKQERKRFSTPERAHPEERRFPVGRVGFVGGRAITQVALRKMRNGTSPRQTSNSKIQTSENWKNRRARLPPSHYVVHWAVAPFPSCGSVQWLAHATAHVILARRQNRPARSQYCWSLHRSRCCRSHPCAFSAGPIQGGAGLRPVAACVSHAAGYDGQEDWRARGSVTGQGCCSSEPWVVHWHNEPFFPKVGASWRALNIHLPDDRLEKSLGSSGASPSRWSTARPRSAGWSLELEVLLDFGV